MTEQAKALVVVRDELAPMQGDFRAMLPAHITAEKFQQTVIAALERDPTLLLADRQSLFVAAKEAAQDGLLPDRKEGAFVVYNNQVERPTGRGHSTEKVWVKMVRWTPMVYGIRKKMFQTGQIQDMQVELVYERDEYRREAGDNATIHHVPMDFGDRGKLRGGYAIIRLKDGGAFREVMSIEQINAVEGVSKSSTGPWKGPFKTEMQRKTILRRLAKQVPMTGDVERVLARDDSLYNIDIERGHMADSVEQKTIPRAALFSEKAHVKRLPAIEAATEPHKGPSEAVSEATPTEEPKGVPEAQRLVMAILHAETLADLLELSSEAEGVECSAEERSWIDESVEKARERLMPPIDAEAEFEEVGDALPEASLVGEASAESSTVDAEPGPFDATAAESGDDLGEVAEPASGAGTETGDGSLGTGKPTSQPPPLTKTDAVVLRAIITSTMGVRTYDAEKAWSEAILSKASSLNDRTKLQAFWNANAGYVHAAREAGCQEAFRVLKQIAARGIEVG